MAKKSSINVINNPEANEKLHEEQSKPGKVRKGKMNFETNEIEYDDNDEDPVVEELKTEKAKTKRERIAEKMQQEIDAQKADKKEIESASVKGDTLTIKLKPSQLPTPPAHQRKTVEPPKSKDGVITINDLVTQYEMDGKKIRRIIRNLGYKAPSTGEQGFGAKARYEFTSDSPILKKIINALNEEKGA